MRLGEFDATVLVDNRRLEEYDIEVSDAGDEIICWVPSTAGKAFSVRWRCLHTRRRTHHFVGDVYLDGTFCGGTLVRRYSQPIKRMYKTMRGKAGGLITGIDISKTEWKPFTFGMTVPKDEEDESYIGSASDAKEIRVVISKAKNPKRSGEATGVKVPETNRYNGTELGEVIHDDDSPEWFDVDIIPGPLVNFVFQYAPIELLRANGIAPEVAELQPFASAEYDQEQLPVSERVSPEIPQQVLEHLGAQVDPDVSTSNDPAANFEDYTAHSGISIGPIPSGDRPRTPRNGDSMVKDEDVSMQAPSDQPVDRPRANRDEVAIVKGEDSATEVPPEAVATRASQPHSGGDDTAAVKCEDLLRIAGQAAAIRASTDHGTESKVKSLSAQVSSVPSSKRQLKDCPRASERASTAREVKPKRPSVPSQTPKTLVIKREERHAGIARLERTIALFQNNLALIRDADDADEDVKPPRKKVKTERCPSQTIAARIVIDLTGEDLLD